MKEMKETKKGKLKDFYMKHRVGIAYWTGFTVAAACVSVSVLLGDRGVKCRVYDKNTAGILLSIKKNILDKGMDARCYGEANNTVYTAAELGKLGEEMMKIGVAEDEIFTHILMAGPRVKSEN